MIRIVAGTLLIMLASAASAEIVVVGPPSLNVASLTEAEVRQIFSGQKTTIGDQAVAPLDLPNGDPTRADFYTKVMQKDAAQMRSYWARMTFTGKGAPPRTVSGLAELQRAVASNGIVHIGYLDAAQLHGDMKVLFRQE